MLYELLMMILKLQSKQLNMKQQQEVQQLSMLLDLTLKPIEHKPTLLMYHYSFQSTLIKNWSRFCLRIFQL
jgi:hypothetical protein